MLTEFVTKKMTSARFKKLADGTYFGEIPSLRGVWANEKTMPMCRAELREVLEEWLVLQLHAGVRVPGIRIASSHGVYGKHIAA
ncbi:type II toxin-antitoxin system HicB family antitoxin [Candidatus Kaiserbacteria bacterium]|nr:type II toxin-antitoxin system HicB family antitoxin [Candidatus Kaiserbacteria bacterium]